MEEQKIKNNFFRRFITRKQKRKAIRKMEKEINSNNKLCEITEGQKKRNREQYEYFKKERRKRKNARRQKRKLLKYGR